MAFLAGLERQCTFLPSKIVPGGSVVPCFSSPRPFVPLPVSMGAQAGWARPHSWTCLPQPAVGSVLPFLPHYGCVVLLSLGELRMTGEG